MDDNQSDSIWAQIKGLFRGRDEDEPPLEKAIEEAREEGDLAMEEAAILQNVLKLAHHTVYDVMVPRTDMDCAGMDHSIAEVAELILSSGHSRIPIYKDDKDNIVGVVYAKDLLPALLQGQNQTPASEVMRQALFVPDNKNVRDMLKDFLTRRMHMAIALDEYGGTSGLITLEDVMEEIVGDIVDEHDVEEPEEIRYLEDGRVLVSGRFSLEELGETLGLGLHSEQVETLGGFLSGLAGHVPAAGEEFEVAGRRFTIQDADKKLVRWVVIDPLVEPVQDD